MIEFAIIAVFTLVIVVLAGYIATSRSASKSRIDRLEKDVEELKKKDDIGTVKLNDLREFAISARMEINALNETTKLIQEGFKDQERKRVEFLNEIKSLIPSTIQNALAPIQVEIRYIKESIESKK